MTDAPAIDPARLIDAELAAQFLGVSQVTIRQWVHRGKLKRSGTGPTGRALFTLDDLLDAQDGKTGESA